MNQFTKLITNIIGFLQFKQLQKLYYKLNKFSFFLMNYWIGVWNNGEENIFKKIKVFYKNKHIIPVLFDVGANLWQTLLLFEEIFEKATIHTFEPNNESYKTISHLKIKNKNIEIIKNNFWLSNKIETGILYNPTNIEISWHSSLYKENITLFSWESAISQETHLTTLEEYCKSKWCNHIHFLKLDIEGNELNCLLWWIELIKEWKIDFIQFEFNNCAISSRIFFKDYRFLLKDYYDFYRELSYNHWLYQIENYNIGLETFYATNYFLIKKWIKF